MLKLTTGAFGIMFLGINKWNTNSTKRFTQASSFLNFNKRTSTNSLWWIFVDQCLKQGKFHVLSMILWACASVVVVIPLYELIYSNHTYITIESFTWYNWHQMYYKDEEERGFIELPSSVVISFLFHYKTTPMPHRRTHVPLPVLYNSTFNTTS